MRRTPSRSSKNWRQSAYNIRCLKKVYRRLQHLKAVKEVEQ